MGFKLAEGHFGRMESLGQWVAPTFELGDINRSNLTKLTTLGPFLS